MKEEEITSLASWKVIFFWDKLPNLYDQIKRGYIFFKRFWEWLIGSEEITKKQLRPINMYTASCIGKRTLDHWLEEHLFKLFACITSFCYSVLNNFETFCNSIHKRKLKLAKWCVMCIYSCNLRLSPHFCIIFNTWMRLELFDTSFTTNLASKMDWE